MIKKNKEDFNNNLTNVFNLLSIKGHYNIVGSASLKGIYYNSDIDLNEIDKFDDFNTVYEKFKHIFQVCKGNKSLFITDFKCGVNNKTNEPIRWTYNDMIKGFKDGKSFKDCLKDKGMIKLDIIYLLNGLFIEITELYFLNINNYSNYDNKELDSNSIKTNLQQDLEELIKDHLYFKALKRIFSILQIHNTNKTLQSKLICFFNSETGILYKAYGDLTILITLLGNTFRKPNIQDIKNNLQIIKQNLSIQKETHKNCSIIIDEITKQNNMENMKVYIHKLCEYISRVFNRNAKSFLENNYK